MKQLSLTILLLSAVLGAGAQTLNESAFPVAGDVFTFTLADTAGFNSGATGTGVTWNFSSLSATGATQVDSFLSPSATPYAAVITNATVACHTHSPVGNQYIFYKDNTGAGAFQRVANILPDTVIYSIQPSEFQYPLSFGNAVQGSYYAGYHGSGGMNVEAGTISGSADGTGTLITPLGTFSNVIRVHAIRNENDTIDNGAVAGTTVVEYYNWYQQQSYYPVLTYTSSSTSVMGHVVHAARSLGYRQGYVTGINEAGYSNAECSVFPNPANSQVNVVFTADAGSPTEITVYDLAGRKVLQQLAECSGGPNSVTMDTRKIAAGVYTVAIKTEQQLLTRKLEILR